MQKMIGKWTFIIGVVISVVIGLIGGMLGSATPWLTSLLILFGLIVGFLNVAGEDTKDFMLASVVLVITAYMGNAATTLATMEIIGPYISGILTAVLAFVVPATVVVALKEVYALAKP
ncbi:hypothetical protein D6745_04045 [Candidatus Woesearchaeota archaeon]|nr:MAG: hypothetical protein D6745_04045 [Candidatus Woesearchaeota archaeon]